MDPGTVGGVRGGGEQLAELPGRPVAVQVCLKAPGGDVMPTLLSLAGIPCETIDLAEADSHAPVRQRLPDWLRAELHGTDTDWVRDNELVGMPEPAALPPIDRGLHGVRGYQWPPPPLDDDPARVIGAPPQ